MLILTLEDPKGGVGSGGATLNALLVVTEHLSAKAGFGVGNNYDCLFDLFYLKPFLVGPKLHVKNLLKC